MTDLLHLLKGAATQDRFLQTKHSCCLNHIEAAQDVANAVRNGAAERGIAICENAVGACVAANKIFGVRAGVCHTPSSSQRAVEQDEINVLILCSLELENTAARDIAIAFVNSRPIKFASCRGLPPRALRRAVDYLRDHLEHLPTVYELAEAAEMSLFHFSRLFKLSTGVSPHQYILQERINLAKRMLAIPNQSISDICYSLGFSDQSHFTAVFRKMTGVTPRAYRYKQEFLSSPWPAETSSPMLSGENSIELVAAAP